MNDSRHVQIHKIGVENSLHDAGNDRNWIVEMLTVVTIDPVSNVETTIGAQGKQVMSRDCFCLTASLKHK